MRLIEADINNPLLFTQSSVNQDVTAILQVNCSKTNKSSGGHNIFF